MKWMCFSIVRIIFIFFFDLNMVNLVNILVWKVINLFVSFFFVIYGVLKFIEMWKGFIINFFLRNLFVFDILIYYDDCSV